MEKIRFILNGCDISISAIAPADITLKQLLRQCDKIKPDWCACGIKTDNEEWSLNSDPEIIIDYNSIRKRDDTVSCTIKETE